MLVVEEETYEYLENTNITHSGYKIISIYLDREWIKRINHNMNSSKNDVMLN